MCVYIYIYIYIHVRVYVYSFINRCQNISLQQKKGDLEAGPWKVPPSKSNKKSNYGIKLQDSQTSFNNANLASSALAHAKELIFLH